MQRERERQREETERCRKEEGRGKEGRDAGERRGAKWRRIQVGLWVIGMQKKEECGGREEGMQGGKERRQREERM